MRIVESEFIKSAVKPDQYPASQYSDIAFAGKSNVGKSSLLNTLLGRKRIAKISSTPGKTRLINFFSVRFKTGEEEEETGFVNFTDLPGYGYAKVSKKERDSWKKMLSNYFNFRHQLRAVIMLVDIRHKADSKDKIMIEMLRESKIDFITVATKSDKIPKNKILKTIKNLKAEFGVSEIIAVSSLKKSGIDKLLQQIKDLLL
jgi:GTP-binding protein